VADRSQPHGALIGHHRVLERHGNVADMLEVNRMGRKPLVVVPRHGSSHPGQLFRHRGRACLFHDTLTAMTDLITPSTRSFSIAE
jgi:hypothetical protein